MARKGQDKALKQLLDAGADLALKDRGQSMALDLAQDNKGGGCARCVQLLRAKRAACDGVGDGLSTTDGDASGDEGVRGAVGARGSVGASTWRFCDSFLQAEEDEEADNE